MEHLDIKFVKANPSGNTTILVVSPVPRQLYQIVAQQLMAEHMLYGEQVGFVEQTSTGSRLEMMGGEFCGNASRAYAAWLLMGGQEYLDQGGELLRPLPKAGGHLQVHVSGCREALPASVEALPEYQKGLGHPRGCFAEIAMPSPQHIYHGQDPLLGPYSLISFAGISHGILWQKKADQDLLKPFRQLLQSYQLDDSCCGMMFVEQSQPWFIRPLVYVGEVDSLVWERSCGSGSLALLCALAHQGKCSYKRLPIHQPGGVLLLSASYSQKGLSETRLAGEIYFTAQGLAHVQLA